MLVKLTTEGSQQKLHFFLLELPQCLLSQSTLEVVWSKRVQTFEGSSINDVTALGERGIMDFVTTYTIVLKSVTKGEGGLKMILDCVCHLWMTS